MVASLSTRLRKIRRQRKLTQLQMSVLLGVKRTTYVHYETGIRKPSIDQLILMASQLGTSLDYLVGISNFELTYENAQKGGVVKKTRRTRGANAKAYVIPKPDLSEVADRDPGQ
ncbi:MAG: helix-turn-helix transcriptional regulator [Eubacteriales bacterium]|nr:helix-turn-helix transcriptional regulator [Eubacteriales bacterium]